MYKFIFQLITLFAFSTNFTFGQKNNTIYNHKFIAIESGLLIDSYNSMGPRLKFEFQQQLKKRFMYGIAFDSNGMWGTQPLINLSICLSIRIASQEQFHGV